VRGLVVSDWQLEQCDARFYTTPGDGLPHRISQRAVDNIARLGGGPATLLSTSFLRLFEEFRYRDLGLRCRLRDGVCTMSGVAPAQPGYYLVRGAGIPRIDVKGFNRRVDFAILMRRLQAAIGSSGPVVK